MKTLVLFAALFCMTSYCYGHGDGFARKLDTTSNTNTGTVKVTERVCGTVKEVDVSADHKGTIIFTDGKTIGIEKGSMERYGFSMALASIQSGFTFCCDASNAVCKTAFSTSK